MCAQKPVRRSATTHTETCAFSPADTGRWTFNPCSRCNDRRFHLAGVCTAGHAQARNRQKWKIKAAKQKPFVTLSLQNPGCSLLRPNPVPSFCPFVISNAHLFPLIKGIIIYNFLLKNQLCILSIADRNSQLVTWLEKIDWNSSLWKEKKRLL